MSYFRRDSDEAEHLVDRLPVYVFPAIVGSGRILVGMALAGVTTAIILRAQGREPMLWWLGTLAYLASVILAVSGIYAVNVVPPHHTVLRQELSIPAPPPSPDLLLLGESAPAQKARPSGPAVSAPRRGKSRLAELLVDEWKLISAEDLNRAVVHKSNSGRSLVHELARMGLLTDEDLERVLGLQASRDNPWRGSSQPS